MLNFVRNLAQEPSGKVLIGLAVAAVFTVVYWHFMPGMYATKVIFGLALLTEGYRFYNQDIQA